MAAVDPGPLLGVGVPESCELRPSPNKGLGLFAQTARAKDDLAWSEAPVAAMQHTENRRVAAACARCGAFAGGVGGQLKALFRGAYTRHLFGEDCFQELLASLEEFLPTWDAELGHGGVQCSQGCGELYCSEGCRDAHLRECHGMLCVGPLDDEEHPLVLFKVFALQHCDTLLLAAQLLAGLIAAAGGCKERLRGSLDALLGLCHAPFPEACRTEEPRDEAFRQRTEAWIAEAARLLRAAWEPQAPEAALFFEEGPKLLSSVLGLFERNNVTLEIASPLTAFFTEKAAKLEEGPERAALLRLLREKERLLRRLGGGQAVTGIHDAEAARKRKGRKKPEEMALEELLQKPWPAMYGDALSLSAARSNHDCEPNVRLRFAPGKVSAVALRELTAGEELCYAYVPPEASCKARRRQLQHWDFTCVCARCEREAAAAPARKCRRTK